MQQLKLVKIIMKELVQDAIVSLFTFLLNKIYALVANKMNYNLKKKEKFLRMTQMIEKQRLGTKSRNKDGQMIEMKKYGTNTFGFNVW